MYVPVLSMYNDECIFRASPRIMQLNTKDEENIKKTFECCMRGKVEEKKWKYSGVKVLLQKFFRD